MNTYFYVEGKSYEEKEIFNHFLTKGYFRQLPSGKYILKVCGVALYGENKIYFFPKGFDLKGLTLEDIDIKASKLIRTIIKYKNTIRLKEQEVDWLGEKVSSINLINTVQWLIQDYMNNGIFVEKEMILEDNGAGRINWDRTIKRKMPIIENDQFKYLDIITSKKITEENNKLAQIHSEILNECFEKYGDLFQIDLKIPNREYELNTHQKRIILEKKLRSTFKTREIELIKRLLSFINSTVNKNDEFALVTPYYYNIWEEMLKITFDDNRFLYDYVPNPYWYIEEKESKYYTKQIPDILIKHDKTIFILDAKYYYINSNYFNKMPGWESIVKQIYYNISVNKIDFESTVNLFVFPKTLESAIKYFGYTSVEGREKMFGYVLAFFADVESIWDSFLLYKPNIELQNEILKTAKRLLNDIEINSNR